MSARAAPSPVAYAAYAVFIAARPVGALGRPVYIDHPRLMHSRHDAFEAVLEGAGREPVDAPQRLAHVDEGDVPRTGSVTLRDAPFEDRRLVRGPPRLRAWVRAFPRFLGARPAVHPFTQEVPLLHEPAELDNDPVSRSQARRGRRPLSRAPPLTCRRVCTRRLAHRVRWPDPVRKRRAGGDR